LRDAPATSCPSDLHRFIYQPATESSAIIASTRHEDMVYACHAVFLVNSTHDDP